MTIQAFFAKYNYISQREIADRIGINHGLLRQYTCGLKQPSKKRVEQIQEAVRTIGLELAKIKITCKDSAER